MRESYQQIFKTLIWIAIIMMIARLFSLPFDVLYDTTDARYAEIGRRMAESGNFITPYIEDNFPFWAKPPLSFWATAISIKIFGVNEFGAKLPHLLFLVGAAAVMFGFVKKYTDKLTAASAVAILSTMTLFAFWAGGVMTDPALVLCLTLAMVGFYNMINSNIPPPNSCYAIKDCCTRIPPHRGAGSANSRGRILFAPTGTVSAWGYLFFAALGLGLLAKGPLIFVLTGFPIFLFLVFKNRWRDFFKNMPWIGGIALMLIIAVPWYIAAERATPGFLEYFIIGEHWERYITPHWAGDLYGGGRGGFAGKIWLFWIAAAAPWSIYFAVRTFSKKFRARIVEAQLFKNDFMFYALCFAAAPLLFFTLSKNVIITYAILSLVPTAILLSAIVPTDTRKFKWFAGIGIFALIGMIMLPSLKPTEKFRVAKAGGETVYYYDMDVPYSASFYSRGTAKKIDGLSSVRPGDFVIMHDGRKKIIKQY